MHMWPLWRILFHTKIEKERYQRFLHSPALPPPHHTPLIKSLPAPIFRPPLPTQDEVWDVRVEGMWGRLQRREWAGEWLDFRGSKAHKELWRSSVVWGGLWETEAPWGHGAGGGGYRGLGHSPGRQKHTSFPAVSASQVCDRQCLCPINDTLYCNHLLWGQGWCSKVNTIGNKLLGSRYSPLAGALHSVLYRRGGRNGKQDVKHNTALIISIVAQHFAIVTLSNKQWK